MSIACSHLYSASSVLYTKPAFLYINQLEAIQINGFALCFYRICIGLPGFLYINQTFDSSFRIVSVKFIRHVSVE